MNARFLPRLVGAFLMVANVSGAAFAQAPVAVATVATALTAAIGLCLPPTFSMPEFERRAVALGFARFADNAGAGHAWRVSLRAADAGHSVGLAVWSGDFAGAPTPTHVFNCKVALRPGAAADFAAGLGATFGADQTEGGFFIAENGALRPMTMLEMLVEFPTSLGQLHAGQRMIFMQVDQRGPATVVSMDSFEPAQHH